MAPHVEGFDFYIDAFKELSTCRNSSFGPGPIPFSSIVEYAKVYEIDDFDEFLYFMRLMDAEFLRLEKVKDGRKTGKGDKGRS